MSEKYLHEMIDDIEVLIDEAKPARFSPGKIMIEKDVLMTVIEELRKQIPGEIERSHKIILNKDAILEDARVKSQQMIDQAARDAGELIDQNEVVEMAKMRANEIETHAKIQQEVLYIMRMKKQIRSVQVHCAMSMRSWKMYKVMWQVSKKHRRVCLTSCYPH